MWHLHETVVELELHTQIAMFTRHLDGLVAGWMLVPKKDGDRVRCWLIPGMILLNWMRYWLTWWFEHGILWGFWDFHVIFVVLSWDYIGIVFLKGIMYWFFLLCWRFCMGLNWDYDGGLQLLSSKSWTKSGFEGDSQPIQTLENMWFRFNFRCVGCMWFPRGWLSH